MLGFQSAQSYHARPSERSKTNAVGAEVGFAVGEASSDEQVESKRVVRVSVVRDREGHFAVPRCGAEVERVAGSVGCVELSRLSGSPRIFQGAE